MAKNIFVKIKNENVNDGYNFLIIAKIYYNFSNQTKEALDILKQGNEKIEEGKLKQEIEFFTEKITPKEENLIIRIENEEDNDNNLSEKNKDKEEIYSDNNSITEEKKSIKNDKEDKKDEKENEEKNEIKGDKENEKEKENEEDKSSILN